MTKPRRYPSSKKKPGKLERFYKSDKWHFARDIVIARANGLCEKCGAPGLEVHHIVHLTVDNVDDVSISINPANLIYLCRDCHNKEHGRFTNKQEYKFDDEGNVVKK